jgi:hypothetical protein
MKRPPPERLEEVERRLALCQPHPVIERELSAAWQVTRRQVRTYLREVYARWEREAGERRPHRRNELRAQLEGLFRAAYDARDYRSAAVALDRLAKLDGLFAPERFDLTATVTGDASIAVADPERVRRRMVELMAKHPELAALADQARAKVRS